VVCQWAFIQNYYNSSSTFTKLKSYDSGANPRFHSAKLVGYATFARRCTSSYSYILNCFVVCVVSLPYSNSGRANMYLLQFVYGFLYDCTIHPVALQKCLVLSFARRFIVLRYYDRSPSLAVRFTTGLGRPEISAQGAKQGAPSCRRWPRVKRALGTWFIWLEGGLGRDPVPLTATASICTSRGFPDVVGRSVYLRRYLDWHPKNNSKWIAYIVTGG
jgi:hypothetical protein